MKPLLDGKYIRLPVKNSFYLNLHKRDFKVPALVRIFSVQTILKDKPFTLMSIFCVCIHEYKAFALHKERTVSRKLAKRRRRILKDIYLNEYMTIACVRHLNTNNRT
jgi:hypothetical protein